jgi:hypothetical protein
LEQNNKQQTKTPIHLRIRGSEASLEVINGNNIWSIGDRLFLSSDDSSWYEVFAQIPLAVIAQSGGGLFPEALLYESEVDLHVGPKAYLQLAASLATTPPESELVA